MTSVILIRHGETEWNKEKRVQGQIDIPLSEEGKKQAKALSEKLKTLSVDHIYSSTLKRARETAKIISKNVSIDVITDPRLNERNYGVYEGALWTDVDKKYTEKGINFHSTTPPQGENPERFIKRVLESFTDIVTKHTRQTIGIICHSGVLHVLIRHLKNIPHDTHATFRFPNTSISIYHIDDENIVTEHLLADISHLK